MRRDPGNLPDEPERFRILKGLLELCRAQKIDGIWTYNEGTRIGIKSHALADIEYLSWANAAAMIATQKKPALREMGAPRVLGYKKRG